jgi:hypothetical protein
MIEFPITYQQEVHYSMGECDIVYHVYDKNGMHICNSYSEDRIREFVDKVNSMYDLTQIK